jgi:polysaccharide export outer membrane protein
VARPDTEVIQIDLQPMKTGGVLERNLVLRNGDVLYIPRRHMVFAYVVGDVNRPGAYELPEVNRVSALQAISWAGGPAKTARMSDGMLVRTDAKGVRQEFPVDFAAVLEGRQADVDVKPNDVIFIPGSGGKTLGYGLLNTLPTMATYLLIF